MAPFLKTAMALILSLKLIRKTVIILLFLLPVYFVLYKIYIRHVASFGCFDDCFNYLGGYFLLKGKQLYSEIFFNHQPLMAYLSLYVQAFFQPVNIYELLLRHRQILLLFSFIFNFLIIFRFGLVGTGFTLFYEFSKFYLFGDRFLAEGFVVYPLAYLLGIVWCKMQQRYLKIVDYFLGAVFVWFIIFMREPYILAAVFLYLSLLWGRSAFKKKLFSLSIFTLLTTSLLYYLPLKEYFFDVLIVNSQVLGPSELSINGLSILKAFFYPLLLFFGGEWNFFRYLQIGLASSFTILTTYLLIKGKFKLIIQLIFILGLANLRFINPGTVYYAAFHQLIWYGLFVFAIFLLLQKVILTNKRIGLSILTWQLVLLIYTFSPGSFIYDKIDSQQELVVNFTREMQVGGVVKTLSTPKDTLFLDGFDDLIYWQSDRLSPYKYSWFTSYMYAFPKYSQEREEMIKKSPPDFYYGKNLPQDSKQDYRQLYDSFEKKPTLLYVAKNKIKEISQSQWLEANRLLYYLPEL